MADSNSAPQMLGNGPFSKRTSVLPAGVVKNLSNSIPPNNLDIERLVLGALVLEKDAFSQVGEILSPDCFYDPRHRTIYHAIQLLAIEEKPIDIQTVIEKLRLMGELKTTQGLTYIPELAAIVNSTAHLEAHARLLYDKMVQRELITFGNQVIQNAYDEEISVTDTMQDAESRLFEITQGTNKDDVQSLKDLLPQTLEEIQKAAEHEGGLSGVSTGYPDLDKLTSGWQKSDLVIIAARPGMGKTALLISMARAMAVEHNVGVGIFSLEMSKNQMMLRLVVNHTEIPNENVKRGILSRDQMTQLTNGISSLENAPIFIDDTPGISIFDLRSKARRLVRTEGVRVIFIDYLQLMTASGLMGKNSNREQEVSTISRSLKGLAKELNITVIALSQVRRSERTNEGKEPQLSDLRESGAIEQDADMVCFIHRPDYYGITEDQNGRSLKGMAQFIIAKHRNGPTDTVMMQFVSSIIKFKPDYSAENGGVSGAVTVTMESRFNQKGGRSMTVGGDGFDPIGDDMMGEDEFRP
ncbi:MAG: replicative DNA helicase [Bacteroidales bacterium]|nr:replicative DNA helicase [Bacteroidales bacterium]